MSGAHHEAEDHHPEEHGGDGHHGGLPHEPAPPEPRFRMPEGAMVARGVGLAGVAAALGWLAAAGVQKSWLLTPVALVLGIGSVLSAWAAVIHLTGGEKFDDHPFV